MSNLFHFDFYPTAWRKGIRGLSVYQRVAYQAICVAIYEENGPIRDDDQILAGESGLSLRRYRTVKASLVEMGKIWIEDGKIHQKRCLEEIANAVKRSQKAAASRAVGVAKQKAQKEEQEIISRSSRDHHEKNERSSPDHLEIISPKSLEGQETASTNVVTLEPTSYQLPVTTNIKPKEAYAFCGKIIRLTKPDYDRWQTAFTNVDLRAELQNLDDYYSARLSPKEQREWFIRCSNALAKRNREMAPKLDPDEPGPHNNYFLFGRGDRTPKYPL